MLHTPPQFWHGGSLQTNLTAASRSAGAVVTADVTPHTKGALASIIDPTDKPSYGIWLHVYGAEISNQLSSTLVDISYRDTGGGGTEHIVIPDLPVGATFLAVAGTMGRIFFFPCYIPAGVQVCAKCQSLTASEAINVMAFLCQDWLFPPKQENPVAYGVVSASSRGTVVTAAANAFGTAIELGTTTRNHDYWVMAQDQGSDTSQSAEDVFGELLVGPDAANLSPIHRFWWTTNSGERLLAAFPFISRAEVPLGSKIWARLAASAANPYGIVAYGI